MIKASKIQTHSSKILLTRPKHNTQDATPNKKSLDSTFEENHSDNPSSADQKGSKNPKTIKSYNLNTTRNKLGLRPRNLLVNLTNAIITPKNLKPNFP
tara:strand:- start:169 stop:462 length:294 start_codon:yes stop_codon:yes gene_type:complete